jgi:condensin complex subunit 2
MSKAFDEGGAKGLLLVNLGVSSNGCNIVFDSKAEADLDEETDNDHTAENDKLIDISILIDKLKEQTATDDARDMLAALEDLPLVPQLSELRAEHAVLESQGFTVGESTDDMERKRGHYFQVSEEEEKEADRSIHQDALERSRASQGRPSFLGSEAGEEMSYGDDNVFAGDNDDDDDFGGDGMFLNVTPQRASSFSGNSVIETDYETRTQNQATSNFLDMLSSTHDFWSTDNDTQFFKPDLFASQGQNHWAGVSHWNAGKKPVGNKTTATKEKNTNAPRSERKTRKKHMVDFSKPPKGFDFEVGQGLTWSSATIAKHSRNENVLPLDAGILSLKQLQSLFLRPTLTIPSKDQNRSKKAVGFADTDDWDTGGGFDDGDDDDDGPGFFMSSNDDEVDKEDDDFIRELEGVRKVEKVQVGYATIAKKVDVKKLKTDLWKELESKFSVMRKDDDAMDGDESEDETMAEQPSTVLSFKEAVQNMEASKSQSDVTLPFYFICILHLANEKGLRLVDKGLDEFEIIHEGLKSSSNF